MRNYNVDKVRAEYHLDRDKAIQILQEFFKDTLSMELNHGKAGYHTALQNCIEKARAAFKQSNQVVIVYDPSQIFLNPSNIQRPEFRSLFLTDNKDIGIYPLMKTVKQNMT